MDEAWQEPQSDVNSACTVKAWIRDRSLRAKCVVGIPEHKRGVSNMTSFNDRSRCKGICAAPSRRDEPPPRHRLGTDDLGRKDDAKRAVSNDLTIAIGYVSRLARLAVGCNNFDYLVRIVDGCARTANDGIVSDAV
ncbi:hypothetical protein IMY05_C4272001700 [Salix suchowensis]|nr:hypothetical protein IMY05_C4272001700 [Salix suchowensis]